MVKGRFTKHAHCNGSDASIRLGRFEMQEKCIGKMSVEYYMWKSEKYHVRV